MDAANPNGGHQSPVVGTDLWVRATDRRSLSTRRNLYSSAPIAVPTPGCGRSQHPERHGAESRQSAGSLSYQRTTSGRDHSVASALSSLASQTERDDPPGVETTDEHHGL